MSNVDPRDVRNAELEALVAKLLARIADLEARLGQNSSNSSMPPSSDPPTMGGRTSAPTGRKPGGQPGHKGSKRDMVPREKVTRFVEVPAPKGCATCDGVLLQVEAAVGRVHQVVELPTLVPDVTQYDLKSGYCACCDTWTTAPLPEGVPLGNFGPRLTAFIALATGKYRLAKRPVRELLSDVLGIQVALGSISNMEQAVSASITAPVEEARAHIREQPVVHQDETGWWETHSRAWLWVATTSLVAVFTVVKSRGAAVAKQMLGEAFAGTLISDRWCAYNWLHTLRRQVCWAHLQREFEGFVERGGEAKVLGELLLAEVSVMFEWWHQARDGTIKRATFKKKMLPLQREVERLLEDADTCPNSRVAGTCREILKLRDSLWTFVYVEGVEPTNNQAEQDLRHAVIWRKTSFGTHSAKGSRFVERILTVVMTLRKQERNVLEYLTAAGEARLRGTTPPSLLPCLAHPVTLLAA